MSSWVTPARPMDEERARVAVQSANLPTLVMVLYHLTGDEKWLHDPYRPVRSRGLGPNDAGGFPPEVADQIRAESVAAYVRWSRGEPPAQPSPDPELLREMLSIAMGEAVPPEYEALMRHEILGADPLGEVPPPVETDPKHGLRVVIIGAGISGLIAAVQLRRQGIPFVVLERNEDVGGVWLTNLYPGAGVDTPSYLYSFSFYQRPWTTHFGKRNEMLQYLQDMADHYDLKREIRFGTEVVRAEFDDERQQWTVTARSAGNEVTYEGNAVISGTGLFNKPSVPYIEGMDTFTGEMFHTADWPADADLRNKRVAVVGSGASAMQVVPAIVDTVGELTVFQRSPQWVAPSAEYFAPFSEDVHWLMDHVPFYYPWYRLRLAWVFNDRVLASLEIDPEWEHPDRSLNAINDGHRRVFTRYLTEQVEGRPDLLEKCLPKYPPFGKRMLLDNGWFAALRRPNVNLVTEGVVRLEGNTVTDAAGQRHEVDVLVLATGFQTTRYLRPMEVVGRGGRLLSDVWGEDDATAYLGMTVPGFPNFFLMYGPNTNSGAGGSYFLIGESQCHYISDILRQMVSRHLGVVDCRQDVHDEWVQDIDSRHQRMVWSHRGMTTYYRNSKGRVVANLPYRMVDYWQLTREADLNDYLVEPAKHRQRV